MTHGPAWAAKAERAELPAAPITTMSASAAPSSARCRVSMRSPPASARLRTSTRSATAASTARHHVGGGAAVVGRVGCSPAGLVGGDPRLRCDAAEAAGVAAVDADADAGVAGGDRGDLGAVAEDVERRERLRGPHPVAAEALDEPAGAHDLAGAVVGRPALALAARAGEALRVGAEARDVGEGRGVGGDAGVDHADHHAGAAAQPRGRGGAADRGQATYARRAGARCRPRSWRRRAGRSSAASWPSVRRAAKPLSAVVQR